MSDSTPYNPKVSFRIRTTKIIQLTPETVEDPATYRIYYTVEGINDLGAMDEPLATYYLIDYIGSMYSILVVESGYVDVEDSFRTGECPCSNEYAIIYKSVGNGFAPFVGHAELTFLHSHAKNNILKWLPDILWRQKEQIPFDFNDIVKGTAKTYTLDLEVLFGYKILAAVLETEDGSFTDVYVLINATAVTGLSGITVSSKAKTLATATNVTVPEDSVYLVVGTGYTGTPYLIRGHLIIQKS